MAVKRKPGFTYANPGASRFSTPVLRGSVFRPSNYQQLASQQPLPVPAASGLNQALAQTAGAGLSGGVPAGYDINSDPAVAAAHSLAEKVRAQAQAQALAKTVQAAIEYGDPTGVQGLTADQQAAAKNNPFSILSNLQHGYQTGTRDLEEGLNKANLYYSGYRGQQLGEAARGYQDAQYQAGTRFHGLVTDIGDQLANALLNADMMEANAIGSSSGGYYDPGGGGVDPYGGSYSAVLNALRGGQKSYTGPVSYAMGVSAPPKPTNSYPSAFVNIRTRRGI